MPIDDDKDIMLRRPQDVLSEQIPSPKAFLDEQYNKVLDKNPKLKDMMSSLGEKSQSLAGGVTSVDKFSGRPIRAAALAALSGENPLTAGYQSIDKDQDVTGEQVANKFLQRTEDAGMPLRAPGQEEFPLQKPLGAAVDIASQSMIPIEGTMGAAMGSLRNVARASALPKAASNYKNIASALQGGKTIASEIPRNLVTDAMKTAKAEGNLVSNAPKGLSSNKLLTAEEYKEKIAGARMDKAFQEARDAIKPESKKLNYWDLVNKIKNQNNKEQN